MEALQKSTLGILKRGLDVVSQLPGELEHC